MNRVSLSLGLFFGLCFAGCGGGDSGPYSIIDRTEGPRATAVSVEVAAGASQDDMTTWGREITSREKLAGKTIVVNFYHGGKDIHNIKGTFQGGILIPRMEFVPQ
ncbi:hypothetical protein EON83_12930 [bacterium]|nr:MAG: hypothetical protein EON83_12930 [bacterium]